MSLGFEFATAARVVVGAGAARRVPELVGGLGGRLLVCTGARPERHRQLLDGLASAGMPASIWRQAGEPTVEDARAATAAAREHGADVVLAVGGGSVLDLGKAVAALLGNGGDPLDYLEVIGRGRPLGRPALPVVAVPTTAGTGSEVTANAVLAATEQGVKVSLRGRTMLPAVAVVDPELTVPCPPAVTAASGLDALTQCLEPYVSPMATPITDGLALQGLRHAAAGLLPAYRDGSDLAARTAMSVCSLLGGMALANAKLGAVHGFAGVIGGMVAAPHGAICAALLAPVCAANVAALTERGTGEAQATLARYRQVAAALTGDAGAEIADGIGWIRDIVRQLAVPGLAALGVPLADASGRAEIVAKAKAASSMAGNPVALTDEQLAAVLDAGR